MTDEAGKDDKVLCVPANDPRLEHLRDIRHVPEFERLEIEHFFNVYKDLEDKKTETGGFGDRVEAERFIAEARERFAREGGGQTRP